MTEISFEFQYSSLLVNQTNFPVIFYYTTKCLATAIRKKTSITKHGRFVNHTKKTLLFRVIF